MKKSLSLIMALMLVVLSLFTFNIKTNIKAQELTDEQIIQAELNNISVPNEVIFDFPLVTESAYNSNITWTSSNEEVIEIKNGWAVVTRPTDSNQEVTLTVTIERNNKTNNKEFKVTVLKGVTETNTYKINYTLNGGINNPNNPTSYKVGETPKLLTPTNGTVEFLGWYLNGELITELPKGLSGEITVVAKWGTAVMTSIEVITKPTKLEYNAFEKFDAAGLVIRAYFNDNEHSYVDIDSTNTEIEYDKNILHADDTKVVITYHGLKAEVEIKVNKINYDFSNVKFDKVETTYDGLEHVALISGTLPEGVTVKYTNNKLTNAGELTAVASFEYDEVNYNKPADLTTTIKINKAQLEAKVQDVQVKPGVTPVYEVVFKGFVNNENESVLDDEVVFLDNLNNDYSKPGTYPVGLKEMFDNNYEIMRVGGTLTITAGEYVLDVLEETLEKVYNGENQMFEVLVKQDGQTVTDKELEFKLVDGTEFKGATNVGKYEVTVSLKDGEAESLTVTFEITKATYDLTKVEFKDVTVTFDGKEHELVYNNVPEGLEVVVEGDTKLTNAGSVEATISFVNKNSNYNDVTTTLTATLTINKATLTKDLFEALPEVGFTGEAHEPKVNGKLGDYVLTEKDYDITYDRNTEIGTAYVILNGKDNFEGKVELTFTITESDLSRVRKAKEELEQQIVELPETFVLETTNKAQVTWLSTSTALMINEDGTYNTILVENANEVVVYALVKYNNAVDYAKFTFTLPVKDTDTNIEIENVESNITIKAEQLTDTTLANYTVEGEEVVFGYDISLIKENTTVQPNGKVTVRIPIPTEYQENETLKVYHVTKDGTVDMNATKENGYLVFETDSFSHYFVTIEKVEEEPELEYISIAEAKAATGTVTVRGVVTAKTSYSTTHGNFGALIEDATGGLYLYRVKGEDAYAKVIVGQEIVVTGAMSTYNGLVELTNVTVDTITVVNENATLPTPGAMSNDLSAQSKVVVLENAKWNGSAFEKDGTTYKYYYVADWLATAPSFEEGATYTLKGWVNWYNNAQITPIETPILVEAAPEQPDEPEQPDTPIGDRLFTNGAQVIIAAKRTSGNYQFMSSNLGTASTKRYQGVDSGTTDANSLTSSDTALIWTIEYSNNNYLLKANNGQYVTWTSGNSGNLAATGKELSIVKNANGTYTITLVSDSTRKLQLNSTATNNYYAFYTSSQTGELQIIVLSSGDSEPEVPVEKTDAEKVALDKNALTLPSTTEENLTLPTSGENGTTISWSSSDEDVIALDGFVIRQSEDVEVTLTATIKLNDVTDTKEFTVTVIAEKAPIEAVIYELVTDASTLKAGDKIIIVSSETEVAMSTTQNGNNRGQIAITKLTNSISVTDSEVQVLTVQDGNKTGTLAFYTGAGYLYAASSSSNYLRTETALSDNSSWSITIDANGIATIIAQGTNSRNMMQYNQTSSIFACYAQDKPQKGVAIYRATSSN